MFKKTLYLILLLPVMGCAQEPVFVGQAGQKPLEVALSFLQKELPDGYAEGRQLTTITQERQLCATQPSSPQVKITLTVDGLEDDSVRALRHILILEQAPNNPWQVTQQETSYACREGRGHTDFSTEPCI